MRHIPKAYERYRHFKGNCYQILAIAKSSEDATEQVVYQALYPPFDIYVRPLSMFMSEVDHAKYPAAAQRYRFELVSGAETEAPDTAEGAENAGTLGTVKAQTAEAPVQSGTPSQSGEAPVQSGTSSQPGEAPVQSGTSSQPGEAPVQPGTPSRSGEAPVQSGTLAQPGGAPQQTGTDQAPEEADTGGKVDENVMAFLDADTYEQKLKIFSSIRDKVTQEMLNTIAVSLDIEVGAGDLEERYRQIQNCLMTFQRYECSRLR